MQKCDIEIIFDHEKRIYMFGDPIVGKVKVKANTNYKCKKITIDLLWKTHGTGNTDTGTTTFTIKNNEEIFVSGEEYIYPFTLIAPTGPITFLNDDPQIIWYIKASIINYVNFNIFKEETFVLTPSKDTKIKATEYVFGNQKTLQEKRAFHNEFIGNHTYIILGLFFSIPGLLIFTAGIIEQITTNIVFGSLLFIIGFTITYLTMKQNIALYFLGKVNFSINKTAVKAGQLFTSTIKIEPKANTCLSKVQIKLRGVKSITYDYGDDHETNELVIYDENITVSENEYLQKYRTYDKEIDLSIPEDSCPTFIGLYNKINWIVTATISVKNRPKWRDKLEIIVSP